ncbi:DUF6221 family protein [Streptomyces hydrogenans]
MSNDLIAFLRARLDHEEAVVRAAARQRGGGRWAALPDPEDVVTVTGEPEPGSDVLPVVVHPDDDATSVHIALYHPDRMLAEINAKRQMVAEFEKEQWVMEQGHRTGWTEGGQSVRLSMIRSWAAIYDGHLDYSEKWRP